MNTLKCYRCGREYPVSDMRYVTEKKMMCRFCVKQAPLKKEAPEKTPVLKGIGYRCRSCNYKFKRNVTVSVCPYCGRQGTLEASKKTAQSLIEESMDKKFDH